MQVVWIPTIGLQSGPGSVLRMYLLFFYNTSNISKMCAEDTDNSQDLEAASAEKSVMEPDTEHAQGVSRDFSSTETKKLLRKIDWTLLPFLSLLHLLSFLDPSKIGSKSCRVRGRSEHDR